MANECFVEIVHTATDEVVERMGPMSPRKADKVEAGASINLNHADYHTRVVTEPADTTVMKDVTRTEEALAQEKTDG